MNVDDCGSCMKAPVIPYRIQQNSEPCSGSQNLGNESSWCSSRRGRPTIDRRGCGPCGRPVHQTPLAYPTLRMACSSFLSAFSFSLFLSPLCGSLRGYDHTSSRRLSLFLYLLVLLQPEKYNPTQFLLAIGDFHHESQNTDHFHGF